MYICLKPCVIYYIKELAPFGGLIFKIALSIRQRHPQGIWGGGE